MFIYDKNQGGVNVRRIENKMGIHGSPTCELVYKNAHAELCGDRKLGLIKYVMALMNGARLGIAAQSVGISQAAYNEGLAYAKDRKQFGKTIIDFPAVYDMLSRHEGETRCFACPALPDKPLRGHLQGPRRHLPRA
jgi:alkylation response protein AidB-like acyl-CoA dehydrogenase